MENLLNTTQKTEQLVNNIKEAIIQRGGTISMGDGFHKVPNAIKNMPGNASVNTFKDETTSPNKIVPNDAEPYAIISQVGGMTTQSENKIPFPYYGNKGPGYSDEIDGVVYTILEDGGIELVGTPTSSASISLFYDTDKTNRLFAPGTYSLSGGIPSNSPYGKVNIQAKVRQALTGSDITWLTLDSDSKNSVTGTLSSGDVLYQIVLSLIQDKEYNCTVYPMLNEGTRPQPYDLYSTDLRPLVVNSFISKTKNLFNPLVPESLPSSVAMSNSEKRLIEPNTVIVGISRTNYFRPERARLLNRTADSVTFMSLAGYGLGFAYELESGESYTITCESVTDDMYIQPICYNDDGTFLSGKWGEVMSATKAYTFVAESKNVVLGFVRRYQNITTPLTISGVSLVKGSVPARPKTLANVLLPKPVKCEGYGQGIDQSHYNYIDFSNKKYVRAVYNKIFTGEEAVLSPYAAKNGNKEYVWNVPVSAKALNDNNYINAISNYYPPTTRSQHAKLEYHAICAAGDYIRWSDVEMTVDEMKAKLKNLYDNGTPFEVQYILAEPIEIDLSEDITNNLFIEVEPGGIITAVTDTYKPVPSTIKYIIKTGV